MILLKKEENLIFSYKGFSVSANGQAIKTLAGIALTFVVIAGIVSLTNEK